MLPFFSNLMRAAAPDAVDARERGKKSVGTMSDVRGEQIFVN